MRRHLVSLLAGILFLGVSMSTVPPAIATSGEMTIISDTTLTQDHHGTVVIDTDDVTLDCAGHSIVGTDVGDPDDPSQEYGLRVISHSGVRIVDCVVSGFWISISVGASNDVAVASNNLEASIRAIEILSSNRVEVVGNTAQGAYEETGLLSAGVFVDNADHAQLRSNDVSGFYDGYQVGFSSDVRVVENHARVGDRGSGFVIYESDGVAVSGNAVTAGPEASSFVFDNVSNSSIERNWAAPHGSQPGFWVLAGSGNVFRNNFAHFYVWAGFVDETVGSGTSGTANTYADNVCIENTRGVSGGGSRPLGLCDVAGSFIDDDLNTFELPIEWLAWEGITKGCNPPVNDRFCPGDRVTRGQMAAFLHRALRDVLTPARQVEFVDDDDSVFESDIQWLGGTGVTKGCNPPANTRFCPDEFVTRGQMAAFLVRAMGYTDDGGGDLFVDDDGSVFEKDIDRLGTAGVTKGCNPPANTRFCPTSFVTRGQMAAFLQRALD